MTVYFVHFVVLDRAMEGSTEVVRDEPIRSMDDVADVAHIIAEHVGGGHVVVRHWQELPEMSAQAAARASRP